VIVVIAPQACSLLHPTSVNPAIFLALIGVYITTLFLFTEFCAHVSITSSFYLFFICFSHLRFICFSFPLNLFFSNFFSPFFSFFLCLQEKTIGGKPVIVSIKIDPERRVGIAFAESPHGLYIGKVTRGGLAAELKDENGKKIIKVRARVFVCLSCMWTVWGFGVGVGACMGATKKWAC
jgi:hypothetical protein